MSKKTTEKDVFEPHAKPGSRRIIFCPTCGRPFSSGTGCYQDACLASEKKDCPEYCSEKCVPGIPA